MKRLLLYIILLAGAAPVCAADSGIDTEAALESVRAVRTELDSRLVQVENSYRQLMSSDVITAEAYREYVSWLDEATEGFEELIRYSGEISEQVAKEEKSEPRPDDLDQLVALRSYAEEMAAAGTDRYESARRKFDNVRVKIEKQREAQAQAAGLGSSPQEIEKEKQRQLKAAEKARAMGNKEQEFAAIQRFAGLDPQHGGQMIGKFFDGLSPAERGKYSEALKKGSLLLKGGGPSSRLTQSPRLPKPLSRPMGADVPAMVGTTGSATTGAGGQAQTGAVPVKPVITGYEVKEAAWSAVDRFAPGLATPQLREAKLGIAADAKQAWLESKKKGFLDQAAKSGTPDEKARHSRTADIIDGLIAKKKAAAELDGGDQRSSALGEWNSSVSKLMAGSREGKGETQLVDRKAGLDADYGALKTDAERELWLKEHGGEYDEVGGKLAALYQENPEYLKARRAEADAQSFASSRLPYFKDGTELTSDELGLPLPPGQKVTISSAKDGSRGISYKDSDGLSHFQNFDDTVRINEVMDPSGEKRSIEQRVAGDGTLNVVERKADGSLFRTEERKPDGSVTLEVYGPDGKPVASRRRNIDGSQVEATIMAKEGVKRTVFTAPDGSSTFEISALADKDGFPKQSGRIVNGAAVVDRLEIDPKTIKVRTGEYVMETRVDGKPAGVEVETDAIKLLPEAKRAEAVKAVAASLSGGDPERAGPLAQFISQVNRQGGPGAQSSIITVKDDKGNPVYLANILSTDGSRKQVLGQWDKLSAAERAGLASDVGLNISVRSGGTAEDMEKRQYLKLFRFCGEDITDRYSAENRLAGNWFVGYESKADNFIHRSHSGTNAEFKTIKTGTEVLYESSGIFGHTSNAIGTLGKGAVQLTGAAISGAGALTVGWADKNMQADLIERTRSNFYGNDVSRALGKNLIGDYYNKGYEGLKVDEDRNIQSVGREMAKMGKPTLGAVLQGGVNFSNGVATSLIIAPGMSSATGAFAQTSRVGQAINVANKGYSTFKSGKAIWDTGAASVEFVQAHRAFDENDPVSKQRYYAAVTDITTKALQSPKTLSGAFKIVQNIKDVRGALGSKAASSQKPPEELSGFNKFMLEKNEPGMLTKVMTAPIKMPGNPFSKAAGAVEKLAKEGADKAIAKEEEPKPVLLPVQSPLKPEGKIIIPGQPTPNPDAKIIIAGQPAPNPDARVTISGQTKSNPDAKIITSAAPAPPPDKEVKIWLPGEVAPRPDVKFIIPSQPVPNPDAEFILSGD